MSVCCWRYLDNTSADPIFDFQRKNLDGTSLLNFHLAAKGEKRSLQFMKELIQTPVGSIFRKHLVSAPDTIRHCDAINGCGKDGPKFSYRTLEIGITEPNSPDVSIEDSDDNTIRIGIPNILVEGFCNKITASLKVQAEPFRVPALVLCEKGVVEGNLWFRTWDDEGLLFGG